MENDHLAAGLICKPRLATRQQLGERAYALVLEELSVAPGSSNLLALKPGAKGELRPDVEYQHGRKPWTNVSVSFSRASLEHLPRRAVRPIKEYRGPNFCKVGLGPLGCGIPVIVEMVSSTTNVCFDS